MNYLFFRVAEAAEGARGRFIALVRHVLPPRLDKPLAEPRRMRTLRCAQTKPMPWNDAKDYCKSHYEGLARCATPAPTPAAPFARGLFVFVDHGMSRGTFR